MFFFLFAFILNQEIVLIFISLFLPALSQENFPHHLFFAHYFSLLMV